MEVRKQKKYTKEFKEDVVNMIKTGNKSVAAIAKGLGIADGVIYRWYKKSNQISPKEARKLSDQVKKVRALRV